MAAIRASHYDTAERELTHDPIVRAMARERRSTGVAAAEPTPIWGRSPRPSST